MRIATVIGLGGICLLLPGWQTPAGAAEQTTPPAETIGPADRTQLHHSTVTVMSGTVHDGNTTIVQNIAAALDDGEAFRVIPMVGQGPAQTLRDVMSLRGVDMGITQSTVLNHFARTGELGPIREQVVYVAKLFNEDLHLLARSEIADIAALNGKTVNIGLKSSGTEIAARFLFATLGVRVRETHLDAAEAVEKIKSGDIDATVLIGTTPSPRIAEVGRDSGLKLLGIPFAQGLEDDTYPATLTHDDYPALIDRGERVDTIAVCAVLVAFRGTQNESRQDGSRQNRLKLFVDRFFSKFDALREPPSHPKWREVNFAATLEDWQRAPQAQAWIDNAKTRALSEAREKERFRTFLAQTGKDPTSEDEQETLFRAFKAWSERQAQASN